MGLKSKFSDSKKKKKLRKLIWVSCIKQESNREKLYSWMEGSIYLKKEKTSAVKRESLKILQKRMDKREVGLGRGQ